jgi:RNA polymerase sigma factor (sigma-70 family)
MKKGNDPKRLLRQKGKGENELEPKLEAEPNYCVAFRRGEEEGFVFYFTALYPALLLYAFRQIDDRPAAESIVEEAFIKIWQKHEAFTHPKVIKAWLYTTVRIDFENWLRERGLKQGAADVSQRNSEAAQMYELIRVETIRELSADLKSLPPDTSKIFRMTYIQVKSLEEIAEELQLPIAQVRNQRNRGRDILQKVTKKRFSSE